MIFLLDFFSQIIANAKQDNTLPVYEEEANANDIEAETKNVIERIIGFPTKTQPELKSMLHYQLGSLSRMSREVETLIIDDTIVIEKKILLQEIEIGIYKIITHLFTYFKNEFDYEVLISAKAKSIYFKENIQKIEAVIHSFEHGTIDIDLSKILSDAIHLKLAGETTYKRLIFAEEILDKIFHESRSLSVPRLICWLITKNFNHPDFYNYQLSSIERKCSQSPSLSDTFMDLILSKKKLLQIPIMESIPYCPLSPRIRQSILKIIDSEIDFIKENDFLNTEMISSGILDKRYKVSLSVKQLAFYIYLNVEAGLVTEQKAKRIHQYVISNFSTAETEMISEKSFSNGYYVHRPEDIKKVINILAKMLAIAQEKY